MRCSLLLLLFLACDRRPSRGETACHFYGYSFGILAPDLVGDEELFKKAATDLLAALGCSPEFKDVSKGENVQIAPCADNAQCIGIQPASSTSIVSGFEDNGFIFLAPSTAYGCDQQKEAFRHSALHELGHLYGLSHTQDASQIMYPNNACDAPAATNAQIQQEAAQILETYRLSFK